MSLRVGAWADEKGYESYLKSSTVWLHEVGQATITAVKKRTPETKGIRELLQDHKGQAKA